MLGTARKVLALLSRRERVQLAMLFVAMLVTACLEMVSVTAVLPFLSIAMNPAQVHANGRLARIYDLLGFTSTNHFLIALGSAALVALVLANAGIAVTTWAQVRFGYGRAHNLGVRLLEHYACQPYVFFLRRNSADLGKNVLTEPRQVADAVLLPGAQLLARAVVSLAIIGVLLAFDPILALTAAVVLGGAYAGIFLAVRHKLARLGQEGVTFNRDRFKAAMELFGAIKDVKLLGREGELLQAYCGPSWGHARHLAAASVIGQVPRSALEIVAFGGVLLIAVYLLMRGGSLEQVIPVLGLYVFAGYRLMPGLQQIFQALTQIRFGAPALDNLHRELTAGGSRPLAASRRGNGHARETLPVRERLELDGVTFSYPGAPRPAIRDVSLTIEANTTVGMMGATGSGKTTLADIILGLLRPQAGEIRIDGVPLTDANLRAWQNNLGYVPQHIYLSDASVTRNIAFGVPDAEIDHAAVERAARIANIHDFVEHELPAGYATVVGERGIRLSGGQRQRIGIARALYHDPGFLVFDEATSALDHDTEAAVIEAISELAGHRTILMIAHRTTTLRGCEVIVTVQNGSTEQRDRRAPTLQGPSIVPTLDRWRIPSPGSPDPSPGLNERVSSS